MPRQCLLLLLALAAVLRAAAGPTVLLVAGAPSHGPGEHRFPDGCALLARALNESGLPLRAEVSAGWPAADVLARASVVVLYSDGLGDHVARGHAADLGDCLRGGRALAVLHFALEPEPGALADVLLAEVGGRFDADRSTNPVWKPETVTLTPHPVTRGVRPFAVEDEWYLQLRFAPGVVPLVQAVPPLAAVGPDGPRSGNAAVRASVAAREPQVLAWAREGEGIRAFGFTGGHFHRNWADPDFRKLVLNACAWLARVEVPADGVPSTVAPMPRYPTLDEAIARGDVADVQLHLQLAPAQVHAPGRGGLLPLHGAILRNRAEIAGLLLAAGASPDTPDRSGRTPLHLAVERGNAAVVALLLERHARANELDREGWTPLHHAAAKDLVPVARTLLAGGADVHVLSARGGSPLHEAAASGSADMVRLLLDAGADPGIVSKNGVTALDIAREYKNDAALALLAPLAPAGTR